MISEKRKKHLERLRKINTGKRSGETIKCESCGKEFYVMQARIRQAKKKGNSIRFCSHQCYDRSGDKNVFWKGGKYKENYDRRMINGKTVRVHRFIIEQALGIKLDEKWVVHHINEDTMDNRLENLYIFKNYSEHSKYHINTPNKELKSNIWDFVLT